MYHIESLLSARLFLVPRLIGDKLYFISNLNGRNSLYVMDHGGSVPLPLLPPQIALQNPHHMNGVSFAVFPKLGKILVMLDQNGDENYQPVFIPIDGGYPEPFQPDVFSSGDGVASSVSAWGEDLERNLIYMLVQSRTEALFTAYQANLATGELIELGRSMFGGYPAALNADHTQFILVEGYGAGDQALFRKNLVDTERTLLFGKPLTARQPGEKVDLIAINGLAFACGDQGLLFNSAMFADTYITAYMPLAAPDQIQQVPIIGLVHEGMGELEDVVHLVDRRYLLTYNIDGCSWLYEAEFDEADLTLHILHTLVGEGELANGVLEAINYDKADDRYALSFATAVSPTQLYTIEGQTRNVIRHTNEAILGINPDLLAAGEDASYDSFDGLRISARLYLPAPALGYAEPHPVIYYIHGGPQSQERPDFAWFSMPLIQFLTLNGFAVFVPNVRGSTGYGFNYMKKVDHDWGGQDRLDHVHAMTEILPRDARLDSKRAAVIGRSYGGYMTLTLVGRHPELWQAGVDMFGPYDLLTFADRVPETWKPFIKLTVGDPETEQDFMRERSPKTYMSQLACPLLVIQGKNDPRVIELESKELVDALREMGKDVDYIMLGDEGHDILKFENKVMVYNAITDFFKTQLQKGRNITEKMPSAAG